MALAQGEGIALLLPRTVTETDADCVPQALKVPPGTPDGEVTPDSDTLMLLLPLKVRVTSGEADRVNEPVGVE